MLSIDGRETQHKYDVEISGFDYGHRHAVMDVLDTYLDGSHDVTYDDDIAASTTVVWAETEMEAESQVRAILDDIAGIAYTLTVTDTGETH